jgi:hypothetical protein
VRREPHISALHQHTSRVQNTNRLSLQKEQRNQERLAQGQWKHASVQVITFPQISYHMTSAYLALLDFSQLNSRNGESVSGVNVKRIVTRLNIAASLYTHAAPSILARQIILSVIPASIPETLAGATLQPPTPIPYNANPAVIF